MNKLLLALAVIAAAAPVRAQSFEIQVADALRPFEAEDAFAEFQACGALDMKTIRPFTLEEAADLAKPCLAAVAKRHGARIAIEPGFLSLPQDGLPARTGLMIKTDMAAGSKAHRDLLAAVSRREGRLLGHRVKIVTKEDILPSSASALQKAVDNCMLLTVVRELRSGEDFVKIYGACLTRNPDLKIKEIRAAEGLAVALKTEASGQQLASYNGFVNVNAGRGPVQVMILAYPLR